MTIAAVPPEQAREVLAEFAVEVRKALESGQGDATNVADVAESITTGRSRVWVAHDEEGLWGVAVVTIPEYPAGRKVYVELLAGRDMDRWADEMETALQQCAALVDAMCIEGSCRPGLARRLRRRGWRTKAVIMEAPKWQAAA